VIMPINSQIYYFNDRDLTNLSIIIKAGRQVDELLDIFADHDIDVSYFRDKLSDIKPAIDAILDEYIPDDRKASFSESIAPLKPE